MHGSDVKVFVIKAYGSSIPENPILKYRQAETSQSSPFERYRMRPANKILIKHRLRKKNPNG